MSGVGVNQWVGNARGCGIMNNMCQFGDNISNEISYSVKSGVLAPNIIILLTHHYSFSTENILEILNQVPNHLHKICH